MSVNLVWVTPNAEQLISDMARVSNPANQGLPAGKLLGYLVRNKHWSPFEMVSACFEIETSRDIARQILRHRSFSFQEFSQRYASVDALADAPLRELRMQDEKNRQNSIPVINMPLQAWWEAAQTHTIDAALDRYEEALERGIAKEQARALLPEGLTMSRMFMAGNVRSWMHYCQVRTDAGTQKEHREIAEQISAQMTELFPLSWSAFITEAA
jgi:thymidylate synthase (FAD)